MNLVLWAKKELARMKIHPPKRMLLPPPSLKSPQIQQNPIGEVVLDADLRCIKCQERVAVTVAAINNDIDSIIVHLTEKKVTLTGRLIS